MRYEAVAENSNITAAGQEDYVAVRDGTEFDIPDSDGSQIELTKLWTASADSIISDHLVAGSASEQEKRRKEEERRARHRRLIAESRLISLESLDQQIFQLDELLADFSMLLDAVEDAANRVTNLLEQIDDQNDVIQERELALRDAVEAEVAELANLHRAIGGDTQFGEVVAAGAVIEDLGLVGPVNYENVFTQSETMPGMVTYINSEDQTVPIPQDCADLVIRMAPYATEYRNASLAREAAKESYDHEVAVQQGLITEYNEAYSDYEQARDVAEYHGERIDARLASIEGSDQDISAYRAQLDGTSAGLDAENARLARISDLGQQGIAHRGAESGDNIVDEAMTHAMAEMAPNVNDGAALGAIPMAGAPGVLDGLDLTSADNATACMVSEEWGNMSLDDLLNEYSLGSELLAGYSLDIPTYDFSLDTYLSPEPEPYSPLFRPTSFANEFDNDASIMMTDQFNERSGTMIADNTVPDNTVTDPLFRPNNMQFA